MIIWSEATCIYSKLLRVIRVYRDIYTDTTLRIIHIERIISMRKKEDLKTERKTVLMTKALLEDIEQEAVRRGIKANAVMVERLNHPNNDNTPSTVRRIFLQRHYTSNLLKSLKNRHKTVF